MADSTNKPAFTLRDGRVKLTCWANHSDKGIFYSVDVVKGYQDANEAWKDTPQLSGTDILKAANLHTQAYNKISDLNAAE